jgi:ankyrin repeat protein
VQLSGEATRSVFSALKLGSLICCPLLIFTRHNRYEVVEMLLAKADVDPLKDVDLETPLAVALGQGYDGIKGLSKRDMKIIE